VAKLQKIHQFSDLAVIVFAVWTIGDLTYVSAEIALREPTA
jgi:hypothetical protein